jgi:branched-chain amino acid transport system permease protein
MKKKLVKSLILALLMAAIPYIVLTLLMSLGILNSFWSGIIMLCGINIVLAVSLNLATGYLGQLTLGHAGFMAVGAYVSAILSIYYQWPFLLTLLIGALAAALIGIVVGVPSLRLKGDYLCIITLAFNEIIRVIIVNLKITNGSRGLIGTPHETNFTFVYLIAALTIFVVYSIVHSRHGRAIISVKEDETASELSGINITYYKILAFVISAFFAGAAGALYSHYIPVLVPKYFDYNKSVEILVMVVLGGMGSLPGSIIAAIALTVVPSLLISFSNYRMLIYAIVLIAAMLLKHSDAGIALKRMIPFLNKKGEEESL